MCIILASTLDMLPVLACNLNTTVTTGVAADVVAGHDRYQCIYHGLSHGHSLHAVLHSKSSATSRGL